MNKISKRILSFIRISSGAIVIILGLWVSRHFQPQVVLPPITLEASGDPFLNKAIFVSDSEYLVTSTQPVQSLKIASKIRSTPRPEPLPSPTPTIPWMQFGNVSVLDSQTLMTIQDGYDTAPITSPEFTVIPWTPEVLESGAFTISKKTVVAWEHLGFTGYWIHSGMDWLGRPLAAFPLQNYLEKVDGREMRTPQEFDQNVADCLIGGKVNFQVGEDLLEGKITAVLRIPASDVKMVSNHVMDLVPYLAKTYPKSGFDKLEAPELLLYFCGRQLSGEKADWSLAYYAQSRIFVAIDLGI